MRKTKNSLWPHQLEAVAAIQKGFKTHARGQAHMACGSGKTRVARAVAEVRKPLRLLVLAPSLALIRQLYTEFKRLGLPTIAVCSDPSVATNDDVQLTAADVGCQVMGTAKDVRAFLHRENRAVVLCTYQSAHMLHRLEFDLGIFDEAHKTAGEQGKQFSYALVDRNIHIHKRLFMTATPRHTRLDSPDTSSAPTYSMDQPKIYGPVFFQLSFRQAVERGIVCDYKIVISVLRASKVETKNKEAVQVAISKAMQRHGLTKALSFHSRVKQAEGFIKSPHGFSRAMRLYHVNGSQPVRARDTTLNNFRDAKKAIVTNARCLTEGVDVPAMDCVAFVNPRKGKVDIVQAVGRVSRRAPGKKRGYVFLPLFVRRAAGESLESALKRTDFTTVRDTLHALRENNEILNAELGVLADRDPKDTSGEIEITDDTDMAATAKVNFTALRKAVATEVMRGLTTRRRDPDAKKDALIERAARGAPKPNAKDKNAFERELARAFALYTYKGRYFDAQFIERIKELSPAWFVRKMAESKKLLIQLAREGQPRPLSGTSLNNRLKIYMADDSVFRKTMLKIKPPGWFTKSIVPFDTQKKMYLEMAKSGVPKPKTKGAIGQRLSHLLIRYPEFAVVLHRANPAWMFASNVRLVSYKGETGSIKYWSKKTGIKAGTISSRLKRGFTAEQIFSTYSLRHNGVTYKGVTRPLAEWATILGMPYGALRSRLRYKWSVHRMLTTPVNVHNRPLRMRANNG